MTERIAAATVHGRYLTIPPAASGPAPMLIGFHGYAEVAEEQLERLRVIPDSDRWLCVSIQALHPFYQRSTNRVVANWMTRQNRELAIVDNNAYIATCIDAVAAEWATTTCVVFAGFSQGVAMAWRAALTTTRQVAGVISVGGDVPPELTSESLTRVSAALLARGATDGWYSKEKFTADERRLREAGVQVRAIEVDAGHEWSSEVVAAAGQFLRGLRISA